MSVRARLAACALVLPVGVACFHVARADAQREDVTIRLERFYDNACRCYKLRFSGTIASDAANEYVAVLQQKCGAPSATAIAGATTRQGGSWEADPVNGTPLNSDSSTYRARWNGRLSEPLTFRADVGVSLAHLGGGRYRVSVNTSATQQNMARRTIELQRLVAGRWTRVQQARLRGTRGAFTAVVTARGRGRTFRIFVPQTTAAPCYAATTSAPWVAGRPAAPGSAAVIDRTLLCSVALQGGIRITSIRASEGVQRGPTEPGASFDVTSNWSPDAGLASASTGALVLSSTRCSPSRARVALTTRSLEGGRPGTSGEEFDCESPRRVLVRVRAVFRSPTPLESSRAFGYPQLTALGVIKEASVAVQTQGGRTLGFASMHESGRARLFAARTCSQDTS